MNSQRKNLQDSGAQDLQNPQQEDHDSGEDCADTQSRQKGDRDSGMDGAETHIDVGILGESERDLLKKFRNKVDEFKHSFCPTCNESFPSIVIVKGECRRCHKETGVKKFSKDNDMDPGEVLDELRDLTQKLRKC